MKWVKTIDFKHDRWHELFKKTFLILSVLYQRTFFPLYRVIAFFLPLPSKSPTIANL